MTLNEHDKRETAKLASLVRTLNASGHNPATSGNYSLRSTTFPGCALVSESGVDKSLFSDGHFIPVELTTGKALEARTSSAETAIHLCVYRATPAAGCVLHSHLLEGLLFADLYPEKASIEIEGLEILKGLRGVTTHETKVTIPCFENTQDIEALSKEIEPVLAARTAHGLLLRRHGLYVWGASVEEAKRHLEVFEYVFRYTLRGKA